MSGIALDASKVNSYVLPKLDKTNSTMQEAYSASLSLKSSLPGSFSYRGMVSDISAQITEVRKEVTQVKKVVTSKVELAKRIESKSESKIASLVGSAGKIGSIIGSAAGAIKGGAAGSLLGPLGAAAGAVTGAIAGGVTGTLMGKTGAKVAAKTVSGVKKVGSWLRKGIKNVGTKIAKGVKFIAGKVVENAGKIGAAVGTVKGTIRGSAFGPVGAIIGGITGAITGGVAGTLIGKVGAKIATKAVSGVKKIAGNIVKGAKIIGNKVKNIGKIAWKAIKNTGARVVNGVTKAAKFLWQNRKELPKMIWNGCKKIAKSTVSFVEEKALPWFKNLGNEIVYSVKHPFKTAKKVVASYINFTTALKEGIVSFAEALIDTAIIIKGVTTSPYTALIDIGKGIFKGDWSFSTTGALWKKVVMPVVGFDATGKIFDLNYKINPVLRFAEKNSYSPFKRENGTVYQIGKGVGYYVGLAVATYFTAGAAAGATATATAAGQSAGMLATTFASSTTTQAAFVALGSFGKNTQKNYNKAIDTKVKDYYIYEEMKNNSKLTLEEATALVEENLANNIYINIDYIKKNAMNNISGGEIAGNIAKAAGTAAIEGGTVYLAGQLPKGIETKLANAEATGQVVKFPKIKMFLVDHSKATGVAVKASKAYVAEGYNSIVNNTEFDWKGAHIDALATIVAESAAIGATKTLDNAVHTVVKKSVTPNVVSESMENASNILNAGMTEEAIKEATEKAFKETTKTLPYAIIKEVVKRVSKNTTNQLAEDTLNSII